MAMASLQAQRGGGARRAERLLAALIVVLLPAQSVSFLAGPLPRGLPRAGSRAGLQGMQMKAGGDLLIVGAGTLGMRLIAEYRDKYPAAKIVACTNTTKRHEDLIALGAHPTTSLPSEGFPNVAYLTTPNAPDYVGLCAKSLDLWTGPAEEGSFILSSSVGVFAKKGVEEGTKITEDCATDPTSSNFTRVLCAAESQVLQKGGSVMRIAGMYNLRKGRNSFFLKGGEVKRRGDAYIGLVGYSDVVQAAMKIIEAPAVKVGGEAFVIADGYVQTVESVFEHGHATLKSLGEDPVPATFTGQEPTRGVLYDNHKARTTLQWSPSVESFAEYCRLVQAGLMPP